MTCGPSRPGRSESTTLPDHPRRLGIPRPGQRHQDDQQPEQPAATSPTASRLPPQSVSRPARRGAYICCCAHGRPAGAGQTAAGGPRAFFSQNDSSGPAASLSTLRRRFASGEEPRPNIPAPDATCRPTATPGRCADRRTVRLVEDDPGTGTGPAPLELEGDPCRGRGRRGADRRTATRGARSPADRRHDAGRAAPRSAMCVRGHRSATLHLRFTRGRPDHRLPRRLGLPRRSCLKNDRRVDGLLGQAAGCRTPFRRTRI